jgi:hypothetical protein
MYNPFRFIAPLAVTLLVATSARAEVLINSSATFTAIVSDCAGEAYEIVGEIRCLITQTTNKNGTHRQTHVTTSGVATSPLGETSTWKSVRHSSVSAPRALTKPTAMSMGDILELKNGVDLCVQFGLSFDGGQVFVDSVTKNPCP